MGLYKRKTDKRKAIRMTTAAQIIGCSSESIRTGAIGNFRLFKLNPEKDKSPYLLYEAELNEYLEKRDADISQSSLRG